MPRRRAKPAQLLSDPDVRRWFENLARGSPATADVNLRRLAALCDSMRTTPSELAALSGKQVHDRFLDFVGLEEARGVSGSYIVRTIKAAKSWLLHNGVKIDRPIKVRGAKDSPSLSDERVPTPQELRSILLAGTPRIRAACALMAFSGLRPEVLGNYRGTDGLRLSDLPELRIGSDKVEFERTPAIVRVRPELSKSSNGYLSFLSLEGCEYIAQYLSDRQRAGEELLPETDLIHPDRARKRFIRTINVGDAVRTAIRGAGHPWRPYVLRHYFDTQLLTAESKGKVARDFRIYWMGHVGSIDARYTTNKRQLPKVLIEEMRAAYARCEPFLATVQSHTTERETLAKIAKLMLMTAGYTEEELADVDFESLDLDLFEELVAKKAASYTPPPRQRVVESTELAGFLDAGWTVVTAVNGHQVVLNPPR